MTVYQRLIASIVSLFVMTLIFELVRRKRLREEYALLWLASGLLMLLVSVSSGITSWVASVLEIAHPAYALFAVALIVGMVLAIHFTVVLSKLTAQNWRLTQEIALLRRQLEELSSSDKEAQS